MRLGDVVLYVMDAANASRLANIRVPWGLDAGLKSPADWPRGAQAHVGRAVAAGEAFPMMVVRIGQADVGGQVFLDGSDTLWVPAAVEGDSPGNWRMR